MTSSRNNSCSTTFDCKIRARYAMILFNNSRKHFKVVNRGFTLSLKFLWKLHFVATTSLADISRICRCFINLLATTSSACTRVHNLVVDKHKELLFSRVENLSLFRFLEIALVPTAHVGCSTCCLSTGALISSFFLLHHYIQLRWALKMDYVENLATIFTLNGYSRIITWLFHFSGFDTFLQYFKTVCATRIQILWNKYQIVYLICCVVNADNPDKDHGLTFETQDLPRAALLLRLVGNHSPIRVVDRHFHVVAVGSHIAVPQ